MNHFQARSRAAFVLPLLALGCGSAKSTNFGESGDQPDVPLSGDGGGADDATVALSGGDGGGLVLPPPTDGGATASSVCKAGVYSGSFMTLVGSGPDSGPSLFSLMWNGNLSIDLKARRVTIMSGGSGNGESFSTDVSRLEIAEGGALDGGDMYGGNFFAALDGELDCDPDAGPPYHLTATLNGGRYASAFYNLAIGGQLSADYQASTPPALTNGHIYVYAPDAGFLVTPSASGTWTANWVSP
jgi:hypothetical protein